ncbi:85c7898d-6331-4c8d-aadb-0b9b19cd73bd [Sclerotinia trifoliorum]|uniref:85c7898d-6331-4c8d-aadb-0b9b19cd73bd n=1 Tax=Sclerotinia trifoliorum TaxID=28548 RepID=A0A8H2W6N2_9HELO|nr:85c7898d-6331-4c8d-aadb-0b9b19cd73bd [Sclerotinia trifoliorum]
MASTNGILSPPTQPHLDITLSAKRKRDDNIDQPALINGITNESKIAITEEPATIDTQGLVQDLIDVLRSHDPSPSILTRPLPEPTPSIEPQAKRQKSDGPTDSPTILSRASANKYLTIDEVLKDIDTAASDIIERLQLSNGANRNQYIPVPAGQSELSAKILAFKKKAHELVRREKANIGLQAKANSNPVINSSSYLVNRNFGSNANAPVTATSEDSKVVLTLYGNAPQPKQLFSSLQIPIHIDGESISQPLREAGLPNGITTTKIVPMQPTSLVDDKKRSQTLGELFPTPPNIHPLKPPKLSKSSLPTSIEGWHQPLVADPRSNIYSKQPVTTGQWLDYSNTSSLSPERKRIRGATSNEDAEAELDSNEVDAAKLDALFRSAYSGFAPTKDDSKAITPENVLNKIWWQRVGEKRWGDIVGKAEGLSDGYPSEPSTDSLAFTDAEMEELEQAVKESPDASIDPNLMSAELKVEKTTEEKDVEEILQEISELLETLNSYQRNRHMSNATGRPVGVFEASETTFIGTPAKPGDSEVSTYEILKSQLALMVAMLPPYAVAKLNSDQLAELSISTKIEVPLTDQKGVMEEDEMAARAKVAAMSAASNTRPTTSSSLHRSSSSAALYGNQYSSSRPAPASTGQHYATAQTPIRPPPSNLQRPPATAPVPTSYTQRAPSAPSYRPAAYPGAAYPHQFRTPGAAAPQYAQTNGQQQQYQHNTPAASYTRPPTQPYQNIPQSTPQAVRYPSQPPYTAQQQPIQNGAAYPQAYGNGAHVGRQSSPPKSVYNQANHLSQSQVRPPYSTTAAPILPPNATRHMQGPLAQPPVMNSSSQSPQPQPQQALPPQPHHQNSYSNMSTFLTSGEQQTIIDRQRAQIVQQQGTQHQARNSAQAGSLGSPQPQINANSAVAAGL